MVQYTHFQSLRGHLREVQACVMHDITNRDTIGAILLGYDIDYHSDPMI